MTETDPSNEAEIQAAQDAAMEAENENAGDYASAADAYDEDVIPLDGLDADPRDTKIAELEAANAEIKDQAMRALAEAENARKRAVKDREDAGKFAVSKFAKDLLSVSDNLRRALDAMPEDADENMVKGIEATERELLGVFERNGIQKLEPIGEMFDPNNHEVMFETPSEGKPAGTITQIMEPGYVLNGRILKPARVGIAKDEGQGSGEQTGSTVNLDA